MLGFSTLQVLNRQTLNFFPSGCVFGLLPMPLENNNNYYYYYTMRETREQSYVRDIYYKVSDSDTGVLNH